MSTTPQTTLQLARQGNPDAIAALMNRHLEAQGITAQVVQQNGTLCVSLEANQVPSQTELVAYVKKGIAGLELAHIDHLTVSARQPGTDAHAWSEDLSLQSQPDALGMELNPSSNNDLDLDFDLDSPALEVQSLDDLDAVLDSGLDSADLDFDLGFTDSSDEGLASTSDFDLNFADSTGDLDLSESSAATDSTDFDLSLTDSDLGFNLDLDDSAAPAAGLDLDLGFADAPAEAPADLDFDLGLTNAPAGAPADLDFDLGLTDAPDEDLSFDLGADPAATDIDLELDLDLGSEEETPPLNFEPVDLSFAPDTDLAADLEPDLDLNLETGEADNFDLDLGSVGETEEAIAAPDVADVALDLTSETPSPSDTIASDLDDLWESGKISADSPDLGFTAAAAGPIAWESDGDFPPLDDMAPLGDDLVSASEAAASGDDVDDIDFEPISAGLEGFESEGFEPEEFETEEFDLTDLSSENLAQAAFVAETPDAEAIEPEDSAFPDPDFSPGADLDDLSPELLPSEEVVFADLGAADALDLSSPGSEASFSDLGPSTSADDDLDRYLSSETEEFADDQLEWASSDLSAVDIESIGDLDPYVSSGEELSDDPLLSDSAPPWGEGEFAPDLSLDNSEDAGVSPGNEFDPGLVFDPAIEAGDVAGANIFATDDFDTAESDLAASEPDLAEAETDFPFDSTMELDETVEGDFSDPGEFGDDMSSLAASPFSLGDGTESGDRSFDGTDDDIALESVELGEEDLDPGFSAAGFDDPGLDNEDLSEVSFDDESFENDSFDTNLFNKGASDSNGFIQDQGALPLASDEPDPTDDFIQEFGTDPSTHVSLAPDQFDKDGSVKSSGGSGLPLRLILGLGLGALILVLASLFLLGRMRQPTPGDPMVPEPEVSAPDRPTPDPAPVAEPDFFREAVNAAQSAANQAQTASTSAQWQEVADSWARAIDLMEQVPESDPNYAVAQQKAVEYQPNRNYAQQNADQLQ